MIFELGGLEFESRSHIIPLYIILTYRSLYGKAYVAQINISFERSGRALADT
jgi:hypothetical protein